MPANANGAGQAQLLACAPTTGRPSPTTETDTAVRILFTGLFGALIAYFVVRIMSRRIREGARDGSLVYSSAVLALGWLAIIFCTILLTSMFMGPSAEPDTLRAVLAAVFGVIGILLLFQGVLSKGWYDSSGIRYTSPLGGKVDELWRDVRSVSDNRHAGWYVLTFKSGKTIRLSKLMCGYGGVLEHLRALGHHV